MTLGIKRNLPKISNCLILRLRDAFSCASPVRPTGIARRVGKGLRPFSGGIPWDFPIECQQFGFFLLKLCRRSSLSFLLTRHVR